MQEAGLNRISPNLVRVTIFVAIAIAYIATAPGYHTTAIDSYSFATIISEHEPFQVPARLFLWLSSMQGLYWLVSLVTTNADPFQVVGYANVIQAALSVVVLQLLLRRHFDVPARAAWLTALIFGTSYGTWRYATELEVYASAILFSVILLLLAFSLDTAQSPARLRQIAAIAGAGALASIFYQPLGIIAGIAIPVFFLAARPIYDTIRYCALYGLMLAASLSLTLYLKTRTTTASLHTVLDTDGKLPSLPDATALAASVPAFLQNLLSVNWLFAFPPTRHLVESGYSQQFAQELIATDPPYWGYRVFLLTLPATAALLVAALLLIRKTDAGRRISAPELSTLAYLAVYALMVLSLHPEGFEAWLPTLVPVFLLLGSRVAGPLERSGKTMLLVIIVGVFALHNWFAGVGIFAHAERDYNRILGEPALDRLGEDDLVVLGTDWPLEVFLKYLGDAETLLVQRHPPEMIAERIEETLHDGHHVLIYSDVISPTKFNLERATHLPDLIARLPEQTLEEGERFDFGDLGFALLLKDNGT